jgi:hypothetical protein
VLLPAQARLMRYLNMAHKAAAAPARQDKKYVVEGFKRGKLQSTEQTACEAAARPAQYSWEVVRGDGHSKAQDPTYVHLLHSK